MHSAVPLGMIGQQSVPTRRGPEQLTLALMMVQSASERSEAPTGTSARPRRIRIARGPGGITSTTPRVRKVPARDSRGRFVAHPTTPAPSWYVLCAAGYRIPGEPAPADLAAIEPLPPCVTPRPTARRAGRRFTRSELHSALLVLLVIVVSAWYRLQLSIPNR